MFVRPYRCHRTYDHTDTSSMAMQGEVVRTGNFVLDSVKHVRLLPASHVRLNISRQTSVTTGRQKLLSSLSRCHRSLEKLLQVTVSAREAFMIIGRHAWPDA